MDSGVVKQIPEDKALVRMTEVEDQGVTGHR
jgi:hypothetical protein